MRNNVKTIKYATIFCKKWNEAFCTQFWMHLTQCKVQKYYWVANKCWKLSGVKNLQLHNLIKRNDFSSVFCACVNLNAQLHPNELAFRRTPFAIYLNLRKCPNSSSKALLRTRCWHFPQRSCHDWLPLPRRNSKLNRVPAVSVALTVKLVKYLLHAPLVINSSCCVQFS